MHDVCTSMCFSFANEPSLKIANEL